jgi:hypothetical protein
LECSQILFLHNNIISNILIHIKYHSKYAVILPRSTIQSCINERSTIRIPVLNSNFFPGQPLQGAATFCCGRTTDVKAASEAIHHVWSQLKRRKLSPRSRDSDQSTAGYGSQRPASPGPIFLVGYSAGAVTAARFAFLEEKTFQEIYAGAVGFCGFFNGTSVLDEYPGKDVWGAVLGQGTIGNVTGGRWGTHLVEDMKKRGVDVDAVRGIKHLGQWGKGPNAGVNDSSKMWIMPSEELST